jgi:hypothetical protein
VQIANVIIADHPANCAGATAALRMAGANLQYPGSACGATIASAEPSLDSRFKPTLTSPARASGTVATCATHDLVVGRDLYGEARGAASCSIGAVEADILRDVVNKVGADRFACFLLIILMFLLACIIAGFLWGVLRRRRGKWI